jgi:hypothetical protein
VTTTDAPALGVSFSHRQCTWLGLDPRETLEFLLGEIGVRHVRLSVFWDEIAPEPAKLDFAPLRPWLEIAGRHGAHVLMTVGLKAQRWPEFYPPEWLTREHNIPDGADLSHYPRVETVLRLMLERVVAFLADVDAIDAWQVENEPFVRVRRTHGWKIPPGLLAREVAVVREADPRRRPVVINHSSRSAFDRMWVPALELGDVLAQNVYTRRPGGWGPFRYLNVPAPGPFAPALRRQAAIARRLEREFWITELQAEPWETKPMIELPPEEIGSVSPQRIRANLRLARRSGASRVYLWGAEWWRYTAKQHGDSRYLDLAREMFSV